MLAKKNALTDLRKGSLLKNVFFSPESPEETIERIIRDYGATLDLDFNNPVGRVTDLEGIRLASITSSVSPITFSQSTDANKQILTQTSNKENLFKQSEDFTTSWTASSTTPSSSAESHPDNLNVSVLQEQVSGSVSHYIYQPFQVIAGHSYRACIDVKRDSGTRHMALRFSGGFAATSYAYFDLTNGAVSSTSGGVTSANVKDLGGGWYRLTAYATATSTASSDPMIFYMVATLGSIAYVGDGTSSLFIARPIFNRASMSPNYISTLTIAKHGSTTGRRGVYYNGLLDQELVSSSTLADVFSASAKTSITIAEQFTDTHGAYLTDGAIRYYEWYNSSSKGVGVNHSDGTTDSTYAAFTVPGSFINVITHDGSTITSEVYGNNTRTSSSAASGATASLTGTLYLGSYNSGGWINGILYRKICFNTKLPNKAIKELVAALKPYYQIH